MGKKSKYIGKIEAIYNYIVGKCIHISSALYSKR